VLKDFGITSLTISYSVLNNAYNNNAAVATIANKIGFTTSYRQLRCSTHTLNLIGQTLLWGKDAEAFDNAGENV
jgi:hypothetical protein